MSIQPIFGSISRTQKCITLAHTLHYSEKEPTQERSLEYDTLILAIGSVTHFFGVQGAEENSFSLDTAHQAEYFRKEFMSAYLKSQQTDPSKPLGITIVGAGATGVELAAELCHTSKTLNSYAVPSVSTQKEVRIRLVELAPRILPGLPEGVSTATSKLLRKLAIDVTVNAQVTQIEKNAVHLKNNEIIPSNLTVWAAGIKAPGVLSTLDGLEVSRQGQIVVKPTLQSVSDDNVFAFGDCASCPWLGQAEGTQVPPRAQAAHQQASFLLKALKQRLHGKEITKSFQYRDFGALISIGHFTAVGNLRDGWTQHGIIIRGWIARWMYASLYRMHIAALHGWVRMTLDTLGQWLSRFTRPRIKLH
jgi:NADH dehydrogenase